MDKKSMGTFLTDLRKEKGLTQQEVADKLNVSNKTISKWERDEGYPEITMLTEISKFYGITTDELLDGGKFSKNEITELTEETNSRNNEKLSEVIYTLRTLSVVFPIIITIFSLFRNFSEIIFGWIIAQYGICLTVVLSVLCFVVSLSLVFKEKAKNSLIEKTALKTVGVTFFFMLVSVFLVILLFLDVITGTLFNSYFYLIPATFFAIITTFCFALIFKKWLKIDISLKKNKKLLKKVVVIAVTFTVIGSVITSLLSAIEMKNSDYGPVRCTVDFINDGMFSSNEEAKSEYKKIKKAVTENARIFSLYSENGSELALTEIHITAEKTGDSYIVTDQYYSDENMSFFTKEEMDEFIKESIVSDVHSDYIYKMKENIVFDNENYCISFTYEDKLALSGYDIAIFYIVIATGIVGALYIVLFIYYNKKKIRV